MVRAAAAAEEEDKEESTSGGGSSNGDNQQQRGEDLRRRTLAVRKIAMHTARPDCTHGTAEPKASRTVTPTIAASVFPMRRLRGCASGDRGCAKTSTEEAPKGAMRNSRRP